MLLMLLAKLPEIIEALSRQTFKTMARKLITWFIQGKGDSVHVCLDKLRLSGADESLSK